MSESEDYTTVTAIAAEGTRVGIVNCKHCGAAVLIDPRNEKSALELHKAWHEREDSNQ